MRRGYILLSLVLLTGIKVFATDFDLGGEIKVRSQNTDVEIRTRLSFDITTNSPLYFNNLLELGYLDIDEDFELMDLTEIEAKKIFLGYDADIIDAKLGIIGMKTPSKYVYDDEGLGIQAKLKLNDYEFKGFYSVPNLVNNNLELLEDLDYMNNMVYAGIENNKFLDLNIWGMYFDDNSHNKFSYYSLWAGVVAEKSVDFFDIDFGFTYNWGEVEDFDIPISAYFSYLSLDYEISKSSGLFAKFNNVGSFDSTTNSITQFQTADGKGNLDTGLQILFSGNESLSLYEDNLSSADLIYDDEGLFIYEFGYSFDFNKIPLTTELVVGGANNGLTGSLIGIEIDLNNEIEIMENLDISVNLAYLFQEEFQVDCVLSYNF